MLLALPFLGGPAYAPPASFDVLNANRVLHLAWSAYCNKTALAAWNCQWCTGPQTFPQKMELVDYVNSTKAGTQGYVAVDHVGSRVLVGYRGSKNFQNAVEDATFYLTKAPFGPSDIRVEKGFLEAYESVRIPTLAMIELAHANCGANCSLLFTGHSLGGAMASLAAAEVAAAGKYQVQLYSYGSPRVGNKAWAAWAHGALVASNGTVSLRMRRQLDIVPAIPPRSIGYMHLPTEVWDKHAEGQNDTYVVCDDSGEDPACGDSEETPPFPLDLCVQHATRLTLVPPTVATLHRQITELPLLFLCRLHLKPAEHTMYMGYKGGYCNGN